MTSETSFFENFQIAPPEYDTMEEQQFRQQLERVIELLHSDILALANFTGSQETNAIKKYQFLSRITGEVD